MKTIDMMDSPVPILIGINIANSLACSSSLGLNKNKSFVIKNKLPERHTLCVFVFLSELRPQIFVDSSIQEQIIVPEFPEFRERLEPVYQRVYLGSKDFVEVETVNLSPSPQRTNDDDEDSFQIMGMNSHLIYMPTKKNLEDATTVISIFRDTLKQLIADRLPKEPFFLANKKRKILNYQRIREVVLLRGHAEKEFLGKFLQTQMFASFVGRLYLEKIPYEH